MKAIITISDELYENFTKLYQSGFTFSYSTKSDILEMGKALANGTKIPYTEVVANILDRLKVALTTFRDESHDLNVESFLVEHPFSVLKQLLDIIDELDLEIEKTTSECYGLVNENEKLKKQLEEEKEKTQFVFNEAKKKLDRPDLQWGGKPYACKINGKPVDIGEQNRFAHFVVASYFASCYLQNEPYNLTPEDALEYAYTMGSYFDDIAFGSDGREKAIRFAFDKKNEDRIRELRNTLMNTYDELFRISGKQTIADELDFVKTELEKREKGV